MKRMRIEGTTYEFTRASDLQRDGFSLECARVEDDGGRTLVLEAFWHDPTGHFSFSCGATELPFALVQAFVQAAAGGCPPIRSREVGTKVILYVKLLNDGTDVWRPVAAEVVGNDLFRITGDHHEEEEWEFGSGAVVRCEERRFSDGVTGLVATSAD